MFNEIPASSNPAIVELLVLPTIIKALNTDINSYFEIRTAFVRDSTGTYPLDRYRNPSLADGDQIRIFIVDSKGGNTQVVLSPSVKARLLEYFRVWPPVEPFDCNGFVHFINDVPFKFCSFDFSRWRLSPYSDGVVIKAGQSILIGHSVPGTAGSSQPVFQSSTHLAVYLSDGLFLSKFGTTEGLIVADLVAMKRGFGGDSVWLLEL